MQQQVRNQQGTVNKHFKNWEILKQIRRHTIPKYDNIFRVIAVVTQLNISNSELLFKYRYKDPPYGEDVSNHLYMMYYDFSFCHFLAWIHNWYTSLMV